MLTIHDLNFLERSDYSAAKKERKLAQVSGILIERTLLTAISALYGIGVEGAPSHSSILSPYT